MGNLTYLFEQGGVMMVPLLLGSILTLAVILERLWVLSRLERGGPAFRKRVLEAVSGAGGGASRPAFAGGAESSADGADRSSEARAQALVWLRTRTGPVAATARAALTHWDRGGTALESAMAAAARRESYPLTRSLSVLETAITAAPLMGLLGTITGMMGVFRVVARRLASDPGADTGHITAGIGEALVATAFGILIAVVAVIFHNLFQSRVEALMDECELLAAELLEARG